MTIGKPSYKRSVRLRELFMQQISLALQEIKDPGLSGLLTVTDLQLSSDMKTARVYYSLLGNARDRESTQQALDRSVGYLRRQVLGKLRLKRIPGLIFIFDDTPEHAQQIENTLNRIRAESGDAVLEPPPTEVLNRLASRPRKRGRRPKSAADDG
ncbi:MAG: 30S ribosome-binding factor RbfA [Elusimicrobiota bacterium]